MTRRDVAALVVRMAVENPQWGYTRIRGALSHLGHEIARTTVKRILHDHGCLRRSLLIGQLYLRDRGGNDGLAPGTLEQ